MVNRLHNNGLFTRTIAYLLTNNFYNPYDLFLQIGLYLRKSLVNPIRYQIHDLFINVYQLLLSNTKLNHEYILFLLKYDYLSSFKVRPKIWWENNITQKIKSMALQNFLFFILNTHLILYIDIVV